MIFEIISFGLFLSNHILIFSLNDVFLANIFLCSSIHRINNILISIINTLCLSVSNKSIKLIKIIHIITMLKVLNISDLYMTYINNL